MLTLCCTSSALARLGHWLSSSGINPNPPCGREQTAILRCVPGPCQFGYSATWRKHGRHVGTRPLLDTQHWPPPPPVAATGHPALATTATRAMWAPRGHALREPDTHSDLDTRAGTGHPLGPGHSPALGVGHSPAIGHPPSLCGHDIGAGHPPGGRHQVGRHLELDTHPGTWNWTLTRSSHQELETRHRDGTLWDRHWTIGTEHPPSRGHGNPPSGTASGRGSLRDMQ
jgi:hypothetical protein